jgi:hypothetical protein
MARSTSTLNSQSVNSEGILPQSGARSQGPVGGASDLVDVSNNEDQLNFFEKAWLFLTDSDYYNKSIGPRQIDKVRQQVNQNYLKHGVFYGFTSEQQETIYKDLYESSKGAIPLAEIVATIATLPFGGGATVGTKLAARLGFSAGKKVIMAAFVDSLGKEIVAVSVELLAGKKVDYSKRAKEIALNVAVGSISAGLKNKLAPILEKKFVQLARKLSNYRVAGLDLGRVSTAEKAVDAKIVEEAVSTMVDSTCDVVQSLFK